MTKDTKASEAQLTQLSADLLHSTVQAGFSLPDSGSIGLHLTGVTGDPKAAVKAALLDAANAL